MPTPSCFFKGGWVFWGAICCQNGKSRPDLFSHSPVQKCNNLPTGTGYGGRETAVTGTAGDILLHGPLNRIREVVSLFYIRELAHSVWYRDTAAGNSRRYGGII